MGTDVTVTDEEIARARRAIMTQLAASGIANGFDSLAAALEAMDMWDFVENQASVVAHLQAFGTRDANIIRKLIHSDDK